MSSYDPAADPLLDELDGLRRAVAALGETGTQLDPDWPSVDGEPRALSALVTPTRFEQSGADWIDAATNGAVDLSTYRAADLSAYRAASEAVTAQLARTGALLNPLDIVSFHWGPRDVTGPGVQVGILCVDDLVVSLGTSDFVRALNRLARWRAARAAVLALGLADPPVPYLDELRLAHAAPGARKLWRRCGPKARSFAEGALLILAGERILAGRIPNVDASLARDACEIPVETGPLAPTDRDRGAALERILAALAERDAAKAVTADR